MKKLILAAALCAAPALSVACEFPEGAQALVNHAFSQVNAERAKAGLHPLTHSRRLAKAAQMHACESAERGVMSHTGANGSDLGDRVAAQDYEFRLLNENVADVPVSWDVVEAWMDSPGHRTNILAPRTREVGFGLALWSDGRRIQWVMDSGVR